ncbi:MAG: flagellar type III secretion system pore protein FliP [Oceanococcaceae bacterium]
MRPLLGAAGVVILSCAATLAGAQETTPVQGLPAVTLTTGPDGSGTYSLSLQLLIGLSLLTLLPAVILLTTAFTRIIVVLGLLRHALGTGQTPSNQVLLGLALMLTVFVMRPTLQEVHDRAWLPYSEGQLSPKAALDEAVVPMRQFMIAQTRESSLTSMAEIAEDGPYAEPDDVPLAVLVPAFVLSELTTAFQIGFMLFIPFVVIDLVVASVLMSMGMMMLSPMLISLPLKIMLFVLVDGWALLVGSLAQSFR